MLVKQEIVEHWYRKDHPVYKNFAFLFQNPLWKAQVPSGFSVCPYFWLSVLSLLLFRPLVMFMTYVVLPLIALGGKPVAFTDRMIRTGWHFVFPHDKAWKNPGFGVLYVLVTLFFAGLYAFLASSLWHLYSAKGNGPGFQVVILSIATLVVLGPVLKYYTYRHKEDPKACKVYVYFFVWLVLSIVGFLCVAGGATLHVVLGILTSLKEFIIYSGGRLEVGVYYLGYWLYRLVCWLLLLVWRLVSAGPAGWYVPYWALFLGGLFGLGYFAKILVELIPTDFGTAAPKAAVGPTETPEQARVRLKGYAVERWRNFFANMMHTDEMVGRAITQTIGYPLRADFFKPDSAIYWRAVMRLVNPLIESAARLYFAEKIEEFAEAGLTPPANLMFWSRMKMKKEIQGKLDLLCYELSADIDRAKDPRTAKVNTSIQFLWWRWDVLASKYIAKPWYGETVADLRAANAAEEKAREALKVKAAASPFRKALGSACIRTTTAIWARVTLCGRAVAAVFRFGWRIVCSVVKNLRVFLAYMIMLVKSKKKGACPYFVFTDSEK